MPGPQPQVASVKIPLPDDEEVRKVVGQAYDPATTLNVVKMFAGAEDMYDASMALVKAVFSAKGIDPKLRQTIILRAATRLGAAYEWSANVPMSLNNGLTQAQIDQIGTIERESKLGGDYDLVIDATDELCEHATLEDATLQRLLDRFGDVNTRKIVLMISWFNLLSRFLNGCRVPLDDPQKVGSRKEPLG